MPSTLLGIARGTLTGVGNRRAMQAAQEDKDLQKILALSNLEGVTIEDPTLPPPTTPSQASTPAGFGGEHRPDTTPFDTPTPDVTGAGSVATAAPAAPRSAMEIARVHVGGKEKVVRMDPALTAGGKARAREAANKAAFDRLNVDGSLGAYEPTYDYQAHERADLDEKELEKQLIAGGVNPAEAKTLAKFHIDLEARRLKVNADTRAENRAQNLEEIAKATLEENKRHHIATEGIQRTRAEKTKGGPLSKDPKVAFQTVEKQIGDTKNAISAARSSFKTTPLGEAGIFTSPADSTAYTEGKARQQEQLSALRNRGDSLRAVSDSLAAVIQKSPSGGSTAAPKGTSPAASVRSSTPSSDKKPAVDTKAMQTELDAAARLYQQLLANPSVDRTEAKTAYDQSVAQITKKYGATK